MSWSDRRLAGKHRNLAAAALLAAASVLAACTVSPVYGPTSRGTPLTAELSAIAIQPVGERVAQEVRNALIFAFTGGGGSTTPRYSLDLRVSTGETQLGIARVGLPPSRSVNVNVSYNLTEIGSGRIVARGSARGVASYDETNQAFANSRARIDAEDRAAKSAAEDARLQIAATLAGRY